MATLSSLRNLAKSADAHIAAVFPGWAATRSAARLRAEQNNYLAAAYQSSRPNMQRSPRSSTLMSENGQLTDADWASIIVWSEETYRNNLIMSGFIRRACDSIVGTGLGIMPQTGDAELDKDLAAGFKAYTGIGGGWEVTNRYSMAMSQRIGFTTVTRSGDFLMYRADDGWQFFEAGQIGTPRGYNRGATQIEKGVELNDRNQAAYYHVARYSKYGYVDASQSMALRADKCRLIGNPEFFSGTRGMPIYHNALARFEDVERYIEAELLGALAAACVTLEINSQHPNAKDALGVVRNSDTSTPTETKPRNIQFAPAQVVQTYQGEKLTMHASNRPSNVFPDFMRINLRLLGFPIGLPLEMALMDFTETNFAAAKMAVVQAAMTHMFWRELVIYEQMLKPVYFDYLDRQRDVRVPDSIKFPRRHYVIEPLTSWLEEYKESLARNAQLEGGWNTITNILREDMNKTLDSVYDDHVNEILLAKQKATAAGIPELWEKVWKGMRAENAKANPDQLQAA